MRFFKEKFPVFIISIFLFLLNFFLKIIYLDSRDIAGDEPFSIFHAQKELSGIIEMLKTENNPPLHFFFLHYWIKVFGISAFSVRLPSLLFSALTSIVLFRIGSKFFDFKIGITAALIFTFSTMHTYFSHEARVYPVFVFLTAMSLFFYLAIVERPGERKNYTWLFVIDLLLIYFHYFGFFVVFVQAVGMFLMRDKSKVLKKLALVFLALLISYIPNMLVFANRFLESKSGTWVIAPEIGQSYGFLNLFINGRYNMMILLLIFIIGAIILFYQKSFLEKVRFFTANVTFKILLTWFVVPYVIMFLASYRLPMFIDRYILYTSIPFYMLIAIVLNYLFEKKNYSIIAALLFIASLIFTVNLNPDNNRRLKSAVEKVKELKTKNNIIIISPDYADLGFTYYYNIDYFKDYNNIRTRLSSEGIYAINDAQKVEMLVSQKRTDIIYLQAGSEFVDPDNLIYKKLSSSYRNKEQFFVYQIYYINHFYNPI